MACFLVPAAEAAVVTAVAVVMKNKEKKRRLALTDARGKDFDESEVKAFSHKLFWLAYLLWGGVILLAFEHLWHGEIVPWFPFLTAAASKESAVEMLKEMATVGVTMSVAVTAVWGVMLAVSRYIRKKDAVKETTK